MLNGNDKKRKKIHNDPNTDTPAFKRQKIDNTNNKATETINNKDNKNNINELMLNELLYQRSQIKHLNYKERILLLGEGDFSFAASLSRIGFCNLIATSYDNYNSIIQKHYNAKSNIQLIKRMKNVIFHNINIHKIQNHNYFKSLNTEILKFDKIIFNFPHSGIPNYEYKKSIPSNKELLCQIFKQSSNLLRKNGELHISLKSQPIYNSWNIQKQCKIVNNGFVLKNRILFKPQLFFGYFHTTTSTMKNKNVESNKSFIWIFSKYFNGITYNWKPIKFDTGIMFSVGMYKCKTCNLIFNSENRYEMHMNSKKHNENKSNANKKNRNKKKKKNKNKFVAKNKRVNQ